jgi:hypothetical protein
MQLSSTIRMCNIEGKACFFYRDKRRYILEAHTGCDYLLMPSWCVSSAPGCVCVRIFGVLFDKTFVEAQLLTTDVGLMTLVVGATHFQSTSLSCKRDHDIQVVLHWGEELVCVSRSDSLNVDQPFSKGVNDGLGATVYL